MASPKKAELIQRGLAPETRLSVWIPQNKKWLLNALSDDVKELEKRHIKSSIGAVVIQILANHYEPLLLAGEKKNADTTS